MIKVVFTYKTKKENIDELLHKFQLSSEERFNSKPSNVGISMFKREEKDDIYIVLDIYYNSIEDYLERTKFERSQDAWNEIWFNKNIKHEEVSVEIFEVLKR